MGNLRNFTGFFFFLSALTTLCCGLGHCLLQIQILSIYCSWFLCVIRKLKFAAGPFILANHADIKSLKALEVAPGGGPLNTSLRQDIVLQLCFHPLPPLVLSSHCFEPQHQTVMRHFIMASPTPTGNRVPMLSPATGWNCFTGSEDLLRLLGMAFTSWRSTQGGGVEQNGICHFTSLVRGFQSHLLRVKRW